jgi:hypothetical protein
MKLVNEAMANELGCRARIFHIHRKQYPKSRLWPFKRVCNNFLGYGESKGGIWRKNVFCGGCIAGCCLLSSVEEVFEGG